jgi:hypothetical protein
MDYDLVRRKTAYVVTVQSPHAGTQAADASTGTPTTPSPTAAPAW